jgi:hypothetical protein
MHLFVAIFLAGWFTSLLVMGKHTLNVLGGMIMESSLADLSVLLTVASGAVLMWSR